MKTDSTTYHSNLRIEARWQPMVRLSGLLCALLLVGPMGVTPAAQAGTISRQSNQNPGAAGQPERKRRPTLSDLFNEVKDIDVDAPVMDLFEKSEDFAWYDVSYSRTLDVSTVFVGDGSSFVTVELGAVCDGSLVEESAACATDVLRGQSYEFQEPSYYSDGSVQWVWVAVCCEAGGVAKFGFSEPSHGVGDIKHMGNHIEDGSFPVNPECGGVTQDESVLQFSVNSQTGTCYYDCETSAGLEECIERSDEWGDSCYEGQNEADAACHQAAQAVTDTNDDGSTDDEYALALAECEYNSTRGAQECYEEQERMEQECEQRASDCNAG